MPPPYCRHDGGEGCLFLTRYLVDISMRRIVHIHGSSTHHFFQVCTVTPHPSHLTRFSATLLLFENLYIPFSSSRLLLVDLSVLHSSTSHTSEGVLEGRGRRVWSGTQWWRARWRDIVEQDTGPASHRTIVTTTSRPPASCTNSSYPFCVHLTSPRTSLKFTPDALYWNPIAITHTIASRASVVDLTSCSVVVYF